MLYNVVIYVFDMFDDSIGIYRIILVCGCAHGF